MINLDNEQKYKQEIIHIIKKHLPTAKIYLFGSRARRTNTPESDVDLALDCGQEINPATMTDLRDAFDRSTIPFFIDLVDISQALSDEFRKAIAKEGILWSL